MTNSEDRVDSWRKEEIQVTTFKDGDDERADELQAQGPMAERAESGLSLVALLALASYESQ